MKKQKYINSLTGLKVICMLLIFWWHSTIPKPVMDLGARSCEFLFVASGFLVGYNAFYKEIKNPFKLSIQYWFRKLLAFWPLHCIVTLGIVWFYEYYGMRYIKSTLLINLALLHAWSPDINISLSFNGATWFLSSLLFCYVVSPFLLKCSKKVKVSLVLFVLFLFLRDGMERIVRLYPAELWGTFLHTNPIIRCMEFAIGIMMVPSFMKVREFVERWGERSTKSGMQREEQEGCSAENCTENQGQQKKSCLTFVVMTVLEVVVLLGMYLVAQALSVHGIRQRTYFIMLFIVVIFVISMDQGLVSRIFGSKPFLWFSKIQFEFFVLHQGVIRCLGYWYEEHFPDWRVMNLALVFSIIVLACGWKMLMFGLKKCFNMKKVLE